MSVAPRRLIQIPSEPWARILKIIEWQSGQGGVGVGRQQGSLPFLEWAPENSILPHHPSNKKLLVEHYKDSPWYKHKSWEMYSSCLIFSIPNSIFFSEIKFTAIVLELLSPHLLIFFWDSSSPQGARNSWSANRSRFWWMFTVWNSLSMPLFPSPTPYHQ